MRRSYTRSSEKEILVQLRNSLNPYEKIETRIMIVQAFTAVVAVVCLLGIAIVGYTKIKDIRVSVQTVAVETTEMANLTSTMGDEMDLMVKTMEPVLLLPNITLEMEQMETGVNQLNDIICESPLFAPTCPPKRRGYYAPGVSEGSQIITDQSRAIRLNESYYEYEQKLPSRREALKERIADLRAGGDGQ